MADRPFDYRQDIADEICNSLIGGESLRKICENTAMPSRTRVLQWLAENEQFQSQYARAREHQAEAIFDECLEIADDSGLDPQHARLRIDTRKWMAGKLKPKKYGDKIDVNHSGSIQRISDEELDARLAQFIGKAGDAPAAGREGSSSTDEQA